MKTRMNILTLACALTCFSCIGTAHTIQPVKTRRKNVLWVIYGKCLHFLPSMWCIIRLPAVRMQKSMLQTMSCPMWYWRVKRWTEGLLSGRYQHPGENRCRVDVYAPLSSFYHDGFRWYLFPKDWKHRGDIRFQTNASGDIEMPCGAVQ